MGRTFRSIQKADAIQHYNQLVAELAYHTTRAGTMADYIEFNLEHLGRITRFIHDVDHINELVSDTNWAAGIEADAKAACAKIRKEMRELKGVLRKMYEREGERAEGYTLRDGSPIFPPPEE